MKNKRKCIIRLLAHFLKTENENMDIILWYPARGVIGQIMTVRDT